MKKILCCFIGIVLTAISSLGQDFTDGPLTGVSEHISSVKGKAILAGKNKKSLQLRVLCYNIHHAEGVDGKLDLPRIARVILSAKPDLVALGEGIASIRPRSQFGFATNHRGTSLSAPLISGVAALLIQAFPRVAATDLVSILRNTASNSAQPNNEVGYGIVRAELAHQSLLDKFLHVGQPEPIPVDEKKFLKTLFGRIKSPLIRPNYPNPFNAETWIPFSLPTNGNVQISIYDFAGYLVQKLRVGECAAGDYLDTNQAVYWDGRDKSGQAITSGNYFAVLSVDGKIYPAMKMTLQE